MNASDFNEQYPFQVSTWLPGNSNPKSIFEKGSWVEEARCRTKQRADEVALCLSLRHRDGVQVAELQGTRFVGYKFIPETAKHLRDGE